MSEPILIVDDEESVRKLVKRVLTRAGYAVRTAESGPACLQALEAGFRGVIMMDIVMPEMTGWDTIREMVDRGLVDGNVISMLTAYGPPTEGTDGLTAYVLDYLTKPFDAADLLRVVEMCSACLV
jgi:CheY-like chemotaxis protein